MKENKCPCEECISFAICYQNRKIECELLYRYLCVIDESTYNRFADYKIGRGIPVYKLYKRWVVNTNIQTYKVMLSITSSREEVKRMGGSAYYKLHAVQRRKDNEQA